MVRYGYRPRYKGRRRAMALVRSGVGNRAGSYGELKFVDTRLARTDILEDGTLLDQTLNRIAQDASENGRIGRKVTVRSIYMKGAYHVRGTTQLQDIKQRIRIIVVLDKQTNGAALTMSDVLNTNGTVDIDSFRSLVSTGRFNVLFDKTYNANKVAIAQDSASSIRSIPQSWNFHFAKKCNIPLEFDNSSATGAIGTITTNNLACFAIKADAASHAEVSYVCRVRYSDN